MAREGGNGGEAPRGRPSLALIGLIVTSSVVAVALGGTVLWLWLADQSARDTPGGVAAGSDTAGVVVETPQAEPEAPVAKHDEGPGGQEHGAAGSDQASESGEHDGTTAETTQAPPATPPPLARGAEHVSLAPAPDPAITAEGPHGPLPVRSVDGRVAWQVYGRPFEAKPGQPLIAVVIQDLGLAEQTTRAAIEELPGTVTLAFSPYAERLGDWVPAARAAGHEVLMQLPMEPSNVEFSDPGDKALMTTNSSEVNLDRLDWLLSRVVGYVGVTNYMGSRLTVSQPDMEPILSALDARGLLYVDARVTPQSIAAKLARELGMPAAANDRFIDEEPASGAIDARLAELEQVALTRGSAIGFAEGYPVTIERLGEWIPELERRGIALAPVSAVVVSGPPH